MFATEGEAQELEEDAAQAAAVVLADGRLGFDLRHLTPERQSFWQTANRAS